MTRSGSKCSHAFDLLPSDGVVEGASVASPVPELSDTLADMITSLAVKINEKLEQSAISFKPI
jgi:hypothetical protein